MQKIIDEEELKHVLDDKGFRFGDRFPTVGFVVSFLDKGTGALLSSNVCKSPIDGVANLPEICKAVKRQPDDIIIILDFGFDYNSRHIADINIEIDKYIYFKKPEEESSSSQNESEASAN